jgi:hypothetical protein
MTFHIRTFNDKPKYCRFPIYLGGERQIHIMQPSTDEAAKPRNLNHWAKLVKENGQIVLSLEAVDDFCEAIKALRNELLKRQGSV